MTNPAPVSSKATARYRRPPAEVMRLARMGAGHPTRLSFLRVMLRRIAAEGWHCDRPIWQVNDQGVGHAVYRVQGPNCCYSLVAFAHDLPDDMRSDRVIATAWDATFTLFDGDPTPADIDRLRANVPLQEAGRITARELTLARANRSVRLFAHVVDALAQGTATGRCGNCRRWVFDADHRCLWIGQVRRGRPRPYRCATRVERAVSGGDVDRLADPRLYGRYG